MYNPETQVTLATIQWTKAKQKQKQKQSKIHKPLCSLLNILLWLCNVEEQKQLCAFTLIWV